VLDRVESTPRRRVSWWPARRTPTVSKILGFAGAAAIVVAVILGARLLGSPAPSRPGTAATPSPSASVEPSAAPSAAEPSASVGGGLQGPYVFAGTPGVATTISISTPGWYDEDGALIWNHTGGDPPEGAGVLGFTESDLWYVPADPCHWASTLPATHAASLDALVAALAAQASRDASAPAEFTVSGHAGKSITLHVPDDAVFNRCDQTQFCTWANPVVSPAAPCFRHHQAPGQIDEFWIVNVDGQLVAFDLAYYAATPQHVIDEMHAFVTSATFAP